MRRDWTAGPIAVALCAALVAAGALWLSADRWPAGTAQAALWAVLTASCVYTANRNLRAELDAARRLLDAWNSSEARDELSLSPPAGTPSVALYDQDAPWRLSLPVPHDEDIVWPLPPLRSPRPRVEMTVAETDRLVGQLQALPGEPTLGELIEEAAADPDRQDELVALTRPLPVLPGEGCRGGDPERIICIDTRCPGHGLPIDGPHHLAAVDPAAGGDPDFDPLGAYWHLGQPCNVCDAPSTSWVSDRPDPEISDVTFLCDGCYAETMSEEDGR